MEKIIENSINYIKQYYPEVKIKKNISSVEFEGRFIIEAKKDCFEIHEAPLLKIVMSNDYPTSLPVCFDVGNCVSYDHVNKDGALCLSTEIDIALKLKDSTCISDFINELIVPYFLSFRYWEKYGHDLFGDYSHGGKGIIESIKSYLGVSSISNSDCYLLLLWASKTKKFKKTVPVDKQIYFLSEYLPFMQKLRLLGIPLLRRQVKMI